MQPYQVRLQVPLTPPPSTLRPLPSALCPPPSALPTLLAGAHHTLAYRIGGAELCPDDVRRVLQGAFATLDENMMEVRVAVGRWTGSGIGADCGYTALLY